MPTTTFHFSFSNALFARNFFFESGISFTLRMRKKTKRWCKLKKKFTDEKGKIWLIVSCF
jgi:hypothetical protein